MVEVKSAGNVRPNAAGLQTLNHRALQRKRVAEHNWVDAQIDGHAHLVPQRWQMIQPSDPPESHWPQH